MGAKILKLDNPLVCEMCGSSNVQKKVWIDANTNQLAQSDNRDLHPDDTWCNNCEAHTGLTHQEDFQTLNEGA